jgi:hypothetical protein
MSRRFISYPTNQLLAVVDARPDAAAAVRELRASGIATSAVVVLSGAEDAERLGGLGGAAPLAARLLRAVQFMTMDQMPDFVLYEEALRGGRSVLAVRPGSAQQRKAAAEVLRRRGHFVNFYGRFATEEISVWRGTEPRLPGYLRR